MEIQPDAGEPIQLPAEALPAVVTTGAHLTDGDWRKLKADADYYVVRDRGLKLLGRQEHFAAALRRKLERYTPDGALIERLLHEFREAGFLDNDRAANSLVERLLNRGGMGRMRLEQELIKRGCPVSLAREVVAARLEPVDESDEARQLLEKKLSSYTAKAQRDYGKLLKKARSESQARYELKQKLGASMYSFLAQRGFKGDISGSLAREYADIVIVEVCGDS
jgi:SOS response regulatory protein OraA/RecX